MIFHYFVGLSIFIFSGIAVCMFIMAGRDGKYNTKI